MNNTFPSAWASVLPPEIPETAEQLCRAAFAGDAPVLPPRVFRALELTEPSAVRAVILGQDPYPTPGHANGLCFSVNPDVRPLPRSLNNILKEYTADLGFPLPASGDLSPWAERGVLLLNTVLTVPAGNTGGHKRLGWQRVTAAVLLACLELPEPAAFLLWGRDAQTMYEKAAGGFAYPGKYALRSSHPSPLGAAKPCGDSPPFLGSRPFSTCNRLLGPARAVDWRLA